MIDTSFVRQSTDTTDSKRRSRLGSYSSFYATLDQKRHQEYLQVCQRAIAAAFVLSMQGCSSSGCITRLSSAELPSISLQESLRYEIQISLRHFLAFLYEQLKQHLKFHVTIFWEKIHRLMCCYPSAQFMLIFLKVFTMLGCSLVFKNCD